MKNYLLILFIVFSFAAKAQKKEQQKIESIHFNLYTDSLKKGVHNYINVDGKLANGSFYPLMSDDIIFSSSAGKWDGNSIIIDSSYRKDCVIITAKLKSNPSLEKTMTVYIKKIEKEETLKTEEEVWENIRKSNKKKKKS